MNPVHRANKRARRLRSLQNRLATATDALAVLKKNPEPDGPTLRRLDYEKRMLENKLTLASMGGGK